MDWQKAPSHGIKQCWWIHVSWPCPQPHKCHKNDLKGFFISPHSERMGIFLLLSSQQIFLCSGWQEQKKTKSSSNPTGVQGQYPVCSQWTGILVRVNAQCMGWVPSRALWGRRKEGNGLYVLQATICNPCKPKTVVAAPSSELGGKNRRWSQESLWLLPDTARQRLSRVSHNSCVYLYVIPIQKQPSGCCMALTWLEVCISSGSPILCGLGRSKAWIRGTIPLSQQQLTKITGVKRLLSLWCHSSLE